MQAQQQPNAPQRCNLFRFMLFPLRTAAMLPLQFEPRRPPQTAGERWTARLWQLLDLAVELALYLVVVHIWVLYVCTLYLNWHKDDLEFLVSCLIQTIIYFWTVVMKLYFRRVRPQRLRRLIDYLNLRYQTRSGSGFTYVTMDETLAYSDFVCKAFVYACFLGTCFWLLLPIANRDRTLPLACWYPFDYQRPWLYEAMFALQSIGQLQVAAAFGGSSSLHASFAILVAGQFDVLFCDLKNLSARAYMAAGAPRHVLRDMQLLQLNADGELRQYYCAKEHAVALDELPPPPAALPQWDAPGNVVRRLQAALRDCVDQHHYIMGALAQMEAFYSPIWYFKTGEVTFLMCLVAFGSVKSATANSSFIKAASLYQYLILVAWEMLIICYFGEVILETSQRCGEALLRSPWYLHMHAMRHDFLFFVMNSQRAFRLTAGKIYGLNVERFRGVMTTAFSFLTLLQKMDLRS